MCHVSKLQITAFIQYSFKLCFFSQGIVLQTFLRSTVTKCESNENDMDSQKCRFSRKDKTISGKARLHSCYGLAICKRRANLSFLALPVKNLIFEDNYYEELCLISMTIPLHDNETTKKKTYV